MIRTMINRCIAEKRPVRIYCQLGKDGYSYVNGIITDYQVHNDAIRLSSPGIEENETVDAETVIPLHSVHSISFDGK